jgi:hypothetical protein
MSLYDKYGLIEYHLANEQNDTITSKIENYFENYLNSDIKVLAHDYINQAIIFNSINIQELIYSIEIFIKNYLIQRRNNIRSFIKKEMFELSDLTKFLKNFIVKINFIASTLNINYDIFKNSILQLNNLIISDSIILIYIEDQVITFNKNIKELLLFIKYVSLTFGNDMYQQIIKLFGGIYKKQIINIEDYPIPINFRRIQKLNNLIKYYYKINNYYNFIKEDITEINIQLFKLFLNDLIELVKNNYLHEIEFTFDKIWPYILNIKKYNFEEKNELMTILSNEIINRCSNILTTDKDVETIIRFGKYSSELETIIKFGKNLTDIIITTYYDKHSIINAKISSAITNYFKPDETETKVINFINNFFNNSILNNQINDASASIVIINHLNNIDLFSNTYYSFLIKRLMNKINLIKPHEFEKYIEIEKKFVLYLSKLGKCIVNLYKINKVINDTLASYYENYQFNNISNKLLDTNISVITTSYNNWDINQTEGIVDTQILDLIKQTQLGKYLKYYELYYIKKYENQRILNWFPHFGEINITYLNQKLKMLPIQFMIVELFNDVDQLFFKDIINSKILINYSEKFKTDIINSIIISELFMIENEMIILSKSTSIKNNLIDIFLKTSDYPNIWEQMKENELAHSREEIVNTIINHTLKTCSKKKSELYLLVNKDVKLFKLDNEIFEKSLKYLIEMDYIKLNDLDEYEKIF